MPSLKTLKFDPSQFAPEERASEWNKFFGNMSSERTLPVPGRPMSSEATIWVAGRVAFTHQRNQVQICESDEANLLSAHKRDSLLAWTATSGIGQYIHDGTLVSIRPGDVFVLDASKDVRAIMTDANIYSVTLPQGPVGYDSTRYPSHMLVRSTNPRAVDFRTWLMETIAELPGASNSDASELALSAEMRVRDLLIQPSSEKSDDRVLSERIADFIDDRIFDEHLSVEQIMGEFDVSRAQLYETLEVAQSLPSYVLDKRLEYALRSLTFGAADPDRIAQIARLCGYETVSDFAAAFEDRFQFSPSLVLGQLAHAQLQSQPARLWEGWLA